MPLPRRVVVVGVTGSGKTTLAQNLAELLGLVHIELDAIHWGPNWTEAKPKDMLARTSAALQADGWVVDGNYGTVRELVWGQADTVVWLNYSLPVILGRLWRRTVRRTVLREVLWNGNVESFREQFLSTQSLFVYAVRGKVKHGRRYRSLFQDPQYQHLQMIELRSPGQTRGWLAGLTD
jgi:adenylate kinase family enzyme